MRICIVGSCSKTKRTSSPDAPTCADLKSKDSLLEWQQRLSELSHPARNMYVGPQARELVKGVDMLRQIPDLVVDYFIISAGFGLLDENDLVPPYECTFMGMKKADILNRSKALGIIDDFMSKCAPSYDLLYLALGKDYFTALGTDWIDSVSGTVIQFVKRTITADFAFIRSGNTMVKAFSQNGFKVHGASGFKGDLLRILANYALQQDDPFDEVMNWTNSYYLIQLIDDFAMSSQSTLQF